MFTAKLNSQVWRSALFETGNTDEVTASSEENILYIYDVWCVGVWVCGCVGVWVCGCVRERGSVLVCVYLRRMYVHMYLPRIHAYTWPSSSYINRLTIYNCNRLNVFHTTSTIYTRVGLIFPKATLFLPWSKSFQDSVSHTKNWIANSYLCNFWCRISTNRIETIIH